jgi:hypothetical protein
MPARRVRLMEYPRGNILIRSCSVIAPTGGALPVARIFSYAPPAIHTSSPMAR